jgi:hypothetical protein
MDPVQKPIVMKKLPFYSLLFIVVIFFYSCKNRITQETDQSGNTVMKEWYSKDQVKSIKTLVNNNPKNYTYISYSRDGSLLDSSTFVNDTLEGKRKFYEEKSGLYHFENYRHGLLHGIHKAVYKSGVTGFEGYRQNNLMVGEWKFHFENGHPITYEYYDSSGVMKYFRKYDDEGEFLKVNGLGMIQVKSDLSKLDSSLIVYGFVEAAIPPGCKTQFTIESTNEGQLPVKYLEMNLEKPKTNWEIAFTSPGQKNLKYLVTIVENSSGKKEESVSEQTINVNPF